ncbi:MAG TPA: hypothetical protein V6D08_07600 [Candidatus Obscuribacterales bacterium]
MATITVAETAASESFSIDELYELQRRRGRLKPSPVAYVQRDRLKAKFRRSDNVFTLSIRSIARTVREFWSFTSYWLWRRTLDFSWLKDTTWNPNRKYDDVLSGRSRFERMNKPSVARWGPLDRDLVYDPHNQAMTRSPD